MGPKVGKDRKRAVERAKTKAPNKVFLIRELAAIKIFPKAPWTREAAASSRREELEVAESRKQSGREGKEAVTNAEKRRKRRNAATRAWAKGPESLTDAKVG